MTIVRCPRCRDEVTVPPRAAGGALVRCPLCMEPYLLSEALAQVPPELIIVSDKVREGFAAPEVEDATNHADGDYLLADGGVVEGPFVTPAARDALATARLNRRLRTPERERNFFVEMAKVILGG